MVPEAVQAFGSSNPKIPFAILKEAVDIVARQPVLTAETIDPLPVNSVYPIVGRPYPKRLLTIDEKRSDPFSVDSTKCDFPWAAVHESIQSRAVDWNSNPNETVGRRRDALDACEPF